MTKYYTPQCDHSVKPRVGQSFPSLDVAIHFYKQYALVCGFDIRLGTTRMSRDGTCVTWKYVYCNREGVKNVTIHNEGSISNKRRTVSNRVDCKARVIFKFSGRDGYVVSKLIEQHTHTLVPDSYKHFMKMNSNLDNGHKKFILACAKANVGAMRSYKILTKTAGAYSKVGCTSRQVKNFSRDLKAFVLDVDAQMILDKMFRTRDLCPTFYFEYQVDKQDQLTCLFWADPISRKNFCAFGDVISFDATYSTNKYGMIFTPFTGKDNHGRCVTLGASLMSGESIECYSWVFEQFQRCMGHGPAILMTDQDPAIKVAVELVFTNTKHRLCMWHIIMKVPERVPFHLKKDHIFMRRLNSLVWSVDIKPNDFDVGWMQMMVEFGLTENSWFKHMFDIRDTWIPAYFRDFSMGGLFRTTSPSESENSVFRAHMNKGSNLLEFLMYFDSALDSQRHSQSKLNNEDLSCCYVFKTMLQIEKHAASVYTRHIFKEVQQDIESACYKCHLKNITDGEYNCLYEVEERMNGIFYVTFDKVKTAVVCTCKKFVRMGLLCCHAYFVFKDLNFETIPEKYIVSRWTKLPWANTSHLANADVQESCDGIEQNKLVLHAIISECYSTVGLLEGNREKAKLLLQTIRKFKDELKPNADNMLAGSAKKRLFEEFYCSTVPEEIYMKPPAPVKTKGSGSRIKPRKEKIAKQKEKPL
ncbi:hypothetical protein C2S52_007070 [Perilla frutescens var. hirtella]|nr:hypothetical protein C2S52_007070 [Perilla frutescens var. hirtella]